MESQAQRLNISGSNDQNPPDIDKFMDMLDSKHKIGRFSLKFQDSLVEQEYQQHYHKDILNIQAGCILLILLIDAVFTTFDLIDFVTSREDNSFYQIQIIKTAHMVLIMVHFVISKYSIKASLYYTFIQSVSILAFPYEVYAWVGYNIYSDEELLLIIVLILVLGSQTYCQAQLFVLYTFSWTANVISYHFLITDRLNFLKKSIYVTVFYCIALAVVRLQCWRDRKKFFQERSQKLVIQMFHNLITVFHDGIIISEGEKITFTNKQIQNIFDCQDDQTEIRQGEEPQKVNEELLIDKLKNTQPKGLSHYLETIEGEEFDYNSLWEYLSVHQRLFLQGLQTGEPFVNPTDGSYFKIKKELLIGQRSKNLQVFSHMAVLGSHQLLMVTIRDISQRFELAECKTVNQSKTIAFAQAAHEFRNPLNGIIQSLNILNEKVDLTKGQPYYSIAKSCSQLMLYQVNDILDYAQFESKQLALNIEAVDLAKVGEECINLMTCQASSKKISLVLECDQSENAELLTDRNRLRQILVNLVSNAIKYTQEGHVKVAVRKREPNIIIEVEDTGVGISEEDQKSLFNPFTKIKDNRLLNKQGCGLGLTISKNLADALGATMTIASTKGQGSTFSLIFNQQCHGQNHDNLLSQLQGFDGAPNKSSFEFNTMQLMTDNMTFQKLKESDLQTSSFLQQKLIQKANKELYQKSVLDDNFSQLDESFRLFQQKEEEKHLVSMRGTSSVTGRKFLTETREANNEEVKFFAAESLMNSFSERQPCQCNQILLVDDEFFNLIPLEGMLEARGLSCDQACNGKEALEMIDKKKQSLCLDHQQYHLVLTDNAMPVMTGIELAQEIRKNEDLEAVSTIYKLALVSGQSYKQMEHLLLSSNNREGVFNFVLEKPLSEQTLMDLLRECNIKYSEKKELTSNSDY